jgi:hypothetical protein
MSGLSPTTRALLEAARSDGPNATTRAKIWGGVASGAGMTTGAATVASTSTAASAGSATGAGVGALGAGKLLAIGALFGSAATIGVATLALRLGAPAPLGQDPTPRARVEATDEGVSLRSKAPANAFAAPHQPDPARATPENGGAASNDDALTREAMLVAEARGALRRGDPSRALSIARSARAIPGAQLEPEELALEAAACRALGREADALSLELELRRKYPGHALAR